MVNCGLSDLQATLIETAPPGAARMLTDAFAALRAEWTVVYPPPPGAVRGLIKLQLSSVTVAAPAGSSSKVTVTADVRARYYPDKGAADFLDDPRHRASGLPRSAGSIPFRGPSC